MWAISSMFRVLKSTKTSLVSNETTSVYHGRPRKYSKEIYLGYAVCGLAAYCALIAVFYRKSLGNEDGILRSG